MDQSETATETESQPTDQERSAAEAQAKVMRAFNDRIGNIVTGPFGNRELRQIQRPNIPTAQEDLNYLIDALVELKNRIDQNLDQLNQGRPLPEINEGSPMVDLKYTRDNNSP